ncbi:membrane protein [Bacteroidia bacterium]|nr:membrane protein [Bacteroidia bacterium]
MELEELKKVWNSFDTRLQQQEMLEKVILKESLVSKSDKGLGRMINYGYFGLTLIVFGLFVLIWAIFSFTNRPLPLRIGLYMTLIFCIYGLIQQITGLSKLHKIDLSSPIRENLQRVSSYRIYYHKQFIVMLSSAAILVIPIIISHFFFVKAQIWQWIFLFGALAMGAVGSWWEYRQMYQKNINTIQKSLEEMKELEEE